MYDLSPLFLYKLQFMVELLIIEIFVLCYCKRKDNFKWKFIISIIASLAFALALPILSYNVFYCIFIFFALASFTVLMASYCLDEDIFKIVFLIVTAYAIQHIAHQLYELVVTITGANKGLPSNSYQPGSAEIAFNPFMIIIYFIVYYSTYIGSFFCITQRYIKNFKKLKVMQKSFLIIALLIMFFAIVLSLFMTNHSYEVYEQFYITLIYIYDSCSCVLALFIMYEVALRERLEIEYNAMSHLYHQEQDQLKLIKNNINMINLKCHDLKHQIRSIGNQSMISKEAIKEIESVVNIYDSSVETGNETTNIILTEKKLFCSENNIQLSCMIDGKSMSFMLESDIYSLLGNLMDNAIEAVLKLENEKRSVSLYVKAVNSFLSINVQNFYVGEINRVNGEIETNKKDKIYHGFGIKSIKNICNKYYGDIVMTTKGEIFNTSIMIPIPQSEK